MSEDFSQFLPDARAMSYEQLEQDADIPNELGGNAQRRAGARAEIKRRDRQAAENLASQQLAAAVEQAKAARWAAIAAWGSVVVAVLIGVVIPLATKYWP